MLFMCSLIKFSTLFALLITFATVSAVDTVIDFAEGKWDKSQWQTIKCFPVKPVDKLNDFAFSQKQDCISFDCSADDTKRGDDNCLMVYDTGRTDAEFEVVFESGKGHPGIFISPDITTDGIVQKTYCIFVADYTFAIWCAEVDTVLKSTKYTHLVRVSKWFPMLKKHKIICRYNKKGFAIKVDDSDTIVIYPENFKVNPKVGIWGCHGLSNYYSMTIKEKSSLLFNAVAPK
jgi:hypothetical protein